ncbi:MAG: alpha/beta fold hydrolase [Planctomycetes bacterium]|nr:alpha/beta fold hydrolase [Planctomycetota bacterium]
MVAGWVVWVAAALPQQTSRTVADVYVPGATAAWIFEQGGVAVGHGWWDYAGRVPDVEPAIHRFTGGWKLKLNNALGAAELCASGEVLVDDGGHPRQIRLCGEAAGTATALDATFAGGFASGSSVVGSQTKPFRIAVAPDARMLINNWIGLVELATKLTLPASGPTVAIPLFHPESGTTLAYEIKTLGTFEVKRGEAMVSGRKYRDSLGEVLRLMPDGELFEVEVAAQGFRMRRTDEPIERFTLEPPRRVVHQFEREEITIDRGGWSIAGEVTKKSGLEGALPAVFFVSGSGLQDRNGMSGGIELGTHELLDHLTEAEFLVLRVDDRGVGKSGGPLEGLTLGNLVDDARAGVEFLLARPDVDPKRVFVIGHSEGGVTAPILACELPLRGIVLMAAPGRSMFAILQDQKRSGLAAAGVPQPMIDSELEVHAKFLELVTGTGEIDPAEVRADYRPALKDRAWLRSHAEHDPIAQIASVKQSVLIAQGAKDVQVSADRDTPPLVAALRAAGNADVTLALFPDLDHLFKRTLSDPPSTADYLKARPVDAEFLSKLTAWLQSH